MKTKLKANARWALIPIFAILSATAAPTDARLTVLLYDYTGLSPTAVEQVESVAGLLLSHAGIRVEWTLCRTAWISDVPEACTANVTNVRLLVRIVDHDIVNQENRVDPLGAAAIENHYATLYAREIRTASDSHGVDFTSVMAYATAHEIGHLLLGPQHGSAGIMQAVWGKTAYRDMAQRWLAFDAQERDAMQDRLRKRLQTALASK